MNLAINIQFPEPAAYELRDLGTEVDDQNFFHQSLRE